MTTVTFDYRAKCRLNPEWAADEIARLRKERNELRASVIKKDDVLRVVNAHLSGINPGDWPLSKVLGMVRESIGCEDKPRHPRARDR